MAPPSKSAYERAKLVERWLAHPRSWSPRPSADGRFVHVLSNREGLPQAYTVEHAGGPLRPFWSEPERVGTVVPSPFDARVVVASDRGGNEHWELSLAGEGGSLVRRLTATPDRIHEPGAWRDARRFLYSSNQRDVRFFDVYECDLDGEGGGRMVRQEDALVSVVAAEGPLALLQRANTNLDVDLFLLRGETEHHLNPHSGEQMVFGADLVGRDVYAGTNPDREFTALVRYPESGGTPEVIRDFPGDVERIRSAPDHVRLAGTSNDHGWSELWVYDSGSSEFANLPLAQPGVVDSVAWSRDGTELFYDLSSAETGTEVFAIDPTTGVSRVVTQNPTPMPGPSHSPERGSYLAEDSLSVEYWDYAPEGPVRGTILSVHGGPEGQARPGFSPMTAFLVGEGFRVLLPNVRGSLGYGRTFLHLDDVRLRMNSVRDLRDLALTIAPGERPDGRPSTLLGVIGGSYGGFMVLSAISTYPDLWGAAVDVVGIANFVTFLERTGPWRRKVREDEYGSLEHDRAFLESISPLHHVDEIRTPLLVVHGANDPRVPIYEAEQIVGALQRRGVPVEFLRFEDEGHGLVRLPNQVVAFTKAVEFFERHLSARSDVSAPPTRPA